jgi:hypothetical protein
VFADTVVVLIVSVVDSSGSIGVVIAVSDEVSPGHLERL